MIINLKTYFTFVILFFIFPQNSFAESTTKSLNQELAQILVTAKDAPKQTLNILTKIKKQQAPELEATTLLFLMKVYDQKKEDDKITPGQFIENCVHPSIRH